MSETYSSLRKRACRAEWAIWTLRYDLLMAQRAAGQLDIDDFIIGLSELGFTCDAISAELRASDHGIVPTVEGRTTP